MSPRMLLLTLAPLASSMLMIGCRSTVTPSPPPAPAVVTTLLMDPEKPEPILGWWVSSDSLIELEEDGGYRYWKGLDRLDRPAESGRWHRENHAVFWLEPYAVPQPPRRRAALLLRDEVLLAVIDGSKSTFERRSSPPRIPADDLLGEWHGTGGHLVFRENGTYSWMAMDALQRNRNRLGLQRGTWRFGPDRRLQLVPFLADEDPVLLELIEVGGDTWDPADDRIVEIHSIEGVLRRPLMDEVTAGTAVNPVLVPTERHVDVTD